MSRNTDPAVTSASQLEQQRFRLLVSIESLSAPYYSCTGDRFIYAMGNTYSPIGHLGGLEAVQEGDDLFPRAVRMWVSIQNSAAMHAALNEQTFRKKVTAWSVLLTNSGTSAGTPQIEFVGRINTGVIDNNPERGNFFEVEVETRLKQAPVGLMMTRDGLQRFLSNSADTFFDHIHLIQAYTGNWGGRADFQREGGVVVDVGNPDGSGRF